LYPPHLHSIARLKGFIMTTWRATVAEFRAQLLEAVEIAGREFPRAL